MGLDDISPSYTLTFPNGMTRHVNRLAAIFILAARFLSKYGPNASEDTATTSAKKLLAAVDVPQGDATDPPHSDGIQITRYTPPA